MKKTVLFILITSSFLLWGKSQAKEKKRYQSIELLTKIIYLIENQYYKEVDYQRLLEGAIEGMVGTLDPHSLYLNKGLMKKVKDDTEGLFGGIGIEVYRSGGGVYIVNIIENSPASKLGIKPGDRIVEIDGKSMVGLSFEAVISKLQGNIGEKIQLGLVGKGKEIKRYDLKREVIHIDPVKGTFVHKNMAYFQIRQFQEGTGKDLEKLLKKFKKKGKLEGIVLDLRNNPGGLLDEAVNVSSLFLNAGVVVSTESRNPSHKDIRYVKRSVYKDLETPMVVLINPASASASEIVAGALQDYKRALIVGSVSFGKGSVQSVSQINEEVGLKLTIAEYLTPKKRKIQALGIEPDITLQDIDLEWLNEEFEQKRYLREKDLRNHFKAGGKKRGITYKRSTMEERLERDYQVQQSVKILEAHSFFRQRK